uniref:Uncharacterized protein n=1 Tax=Meloidogyne enterolobii TaxID=390850 RepID=A0A6V7VQ52_MELEN|nr:unnamed protein product [Meloidogyne enterolobii]
MFKTCIIFYLTHFLNLFGHFYCSDLNKLEGLEKFDKMRVNERNFQLVRNIHANWFATGLKALMGSLGRTLYQKLSKEEQKQLADCLYRVEDKMDLVLAANCLVNARRRHFARIITDQVDNNYKMR